MRPPIAGTCILFAAAVGAALAGCGSHGSAAVPESRVDARACNPAPRFSAISQCLLERTCMGVEGCHGCDASHFNLLYDGPSGLVGTPVWETAHEDAAFPDGGAPHYVRVVPGDPNASYLLWKLTGDPRIVGQRMPAGGQPVSPAWISAITTWIADGAPND